MAAFARCTIDRSATRVGRALATPFGLAYVANLRSLAQDTCLDSGSMQFSPILLRGALFAELWSRRLVAEAKGVAWTPTLPRTPTPTIDDDDARTNAALLDLADCVIASDRTAVLTVLAAPIAGKEQAAAYRALVPKLGPCVTSGASATLSKPILEGALAEALYRAPASSRVQ